MLPLHLRSSLQLECLQVTGSFKVRGALNKVLSLTAKQLEAGLITASGGNHGLALSYAGHLSEAPTLIYVPQNTPRTKAYKMEQWGAQVVFMGSVWDDTDRLAQEAAEIKGFTYVHPFADELVIAGQGTIALEILRDLASVDVLLAAIGGGGMISGVALVAKALNPRIKVIGVEPKGAATLYNSLRGGRVIELDEITTRASSLTVRSTTQLNLRMVQRYVDSIALVSDYEMHKAANWLWYEAGVAAGLSSAASVAALLAGQVQVKADEIVCAIICGSGKDELETYE
jgi:threonine dehydratase